MTFDPAVHPTLAGVGATLRELAGDAAYTAGRDYCRKGAVRNGTVAGTTAYAIVAGSTDYRVSLAFADEPKPSCTCPAHRRNTFCKHVVALSVALLERPSEFELAEPAPASAKPTRAKRETRKKGETSADRAEERDAGLETVETLLGALARDGLVGLGTDKLTLIANAGELVRSRKLRRLGNRILALQRAAEGKNGGLDPAGFAALVSDLALTYRATRSHLAGKIALDPAEAEDLLGKTWREAELEGVTGLELLELAATTEDDGEFRIDTGYLADLQTGTIYVERQIAPRRFHGARPIHRCRLRVEAARLYPGPSPRRIRLGPTSREPFDLDDVARLLACAIDSVPDLQERLVAHLAELFASPGLPVLFRPAGLVARAGRPVALDQSGRAVALAWPDSAWDQTLPSLWPATEPAALFGRVTLSDDGLLLRCLAAVGPLDWDRGPIFPDVQR